MSRCNLISPPRKTVGIRGFTYVELVITLAISSLIVLGLSGVVSQALQSHDAVSGTNKLTREARFAMQRMVHTVSSSRRLLLPLNDNSNTNWPEHIREQTFPASAPVGDSTGASAVLAVTLPAYVDLDNDGFADADDDKDGVIDEDLPADSQHDFSPGIMLIDDDGDGVVDEGLDEDDDEDGIDDEDSFDKIDNDGDASVDEDPAADHNADGCAGICGVDDDTDGTIDEGVVGDDDEDGASFEDAYDPVVFFLNAGSLIERMPVPWDTDGISVPDGPVDGRDFIESVIAENVTLFRVERLQAINGNALLLDITLALTSPGSGETVQLQSQVRLGGGL